MSQMLLPRPTQADNSWLSEVLDNQEGTRASRRSDPSRLMAREEGWEWPLVAEEVGTKDPEVTRSYTFTPPACVQSAPFHLCVFLGRSNLDLPSNLQSLGLSGSQGAEHFCTRLLFPPHVIL